MELGLAGRSVLVTGASQGIGLSCAEVMASEGCRLHIAARRRDALDRVADGLRARHGADVKVHVADLSKPEAVTPLAGACGDLDILVNNAGAIPHGALDEFDDARLREVWNLKLFGYMALTREVYGRMKARGAGAIVNIIGTAGERPNADYIAGSTANAGLMAFTRALGGTSMEDGIRVVGINPGRIRTERQLKRLYDRAEVEFGDATRFEELPQAKDPFGMPEDVAALTAFLASDRAAYISGTVVTIDGGQASRRG